MKKSKLHPEVVKYLKEGMLFGDGLKIDITYRKGNKIWNNRELVTDNIILSLLNYDILVEKIKVMVFELLKQIESVKDSL